jgi:hypothetical protein
MSAKKIRIVGILFGVLPLLAGFMVKHKWLKVLLFIFGAVQIAGNLLADNKMYEDLEVQINGQITKNINTDYN